MKTYKKIFENNEYLIVDKPAGLLTHGAEHIKEKSLADLILEEYPKIKKIGEDPYRPGIVHRLDKLASGLLVIAKTQASFDNIKKQFQKRLVDKNYIALVYGQISKDEDEINFPIARSAKGYKMAALPLTDKKEKTQSGRIAITEFFVKKKFINYTLLGIKIKTGRTHQIRVHLSAYGHPIVGDDLYGTKKTKIKNAKLNLGRLFLFSHQLSFNDLSGKKQTFKASMPNDLKKILEKIK